LSMLEINLKQRASTRSRLHTCLSPAKRQQATAGKT
jgi:hypothetical protein